MLLILFVCSVILVVAHEQTRVAATLAAQTNTISAAPIQVMELTPVKCPEERPLKNGNGAFPLTLSPKSGGGS